jgi:group I intron endonuclease
MHNLNDYTKLPSSPGIYRINCRESGKFYIGSSINVKRRITQHIYRLKKGTHSNPILQAIWNTNEFRLLFECLEIIDSKDKNVILKVEQRYLDEAGVGINKKCMNILKIANSHLGIKRSEETKAKLLKVHLGRKASPETRLKQRLAKLGKKQSPEMVKKRISAMSGKCNRPKGIYRFSQRKFSNEQIIEIRHLKEEGASYLFLSKKFNAAVGVIQRIISRVSYSDVN